MLLYELLKKSLQLFKNEHSVNAISFRNLAKTGRFIPNQQLRGWSKTSSRVSKNRKRLRYEETASCGSYVDVVNP